jgi:hypothetical protein
MQVSSHWSVDPVEAPEEVQIPRMLLWKRTLILSVVGISIGLEGGYLLGRNMAAKTGPARQISDSSRPPITRVKFMPIPDADPGEIKAANQKETLPLWMPPAADSPVDSCAEDLPPRRKARPAFIGLEDESSRQSNKG